MPSTCSTKPAHPAPPADEPVHRRAARYAWAVLMARIYEVFPLRCPLCGADMRIIAFISEAAVVRDILRGLGEPITPPTVARERAVPAGTGLRIRSAPGLVVGHPIRC